MQFFSEEDLRVERVWSGESIGTKLLLQHGASDMTAELPGIKVGRVLGYGPVATRRNK